MYDISIIIVNVVEASTGLLVKTQSYDEVAFTFTIVVIIDIIVYIIVYIIAVIVIVIAVVKKGPIGHTNIITATSTLIIIINTIKILLFDDPLFDFMFDYLFALCSL